MRPSSPRKRLISADTAITSRRKGFEYLNELFIKRHKKILWSATLKIAGVCAFLVLGALLALMTWSRRPNPRTSTR